MVGGDWNDGPEGRLKIGRRRPHVDRIWARVGAPTGSSGPNRAPTGSDLKIRLRRVTRCRRHRVSLKSQVSEADSRRVFGCGACPLIVVPSRACSPDVYTEARVAGHSRRWGVAATRPPCARASAWSVGQDGSGEAVAQLKPSRWEAPLEVRNTHRVVWACVRNFGGTYVAECAHSAVPPSARKRHRAVTLRLRPLWGPLGKIWVGFGPLEAVFGRHASVCCSSGHTDHIAPRRGPYLQHVQCAIVDARFLLGAMGACPCPLRHMSSSSRRFQVSGRPLSLALRARRGGGCTRRHFSLGRPAAIVEG